MAKNTVHVVPRAGDWAVRRSGAERDSSHHRTQEAAIRSGRSTAQREKPSCSFTVAMDVSVTATASATTRSLRGTRNAN